jgi:flagellar basal-body rod protein FlgB
MFDRLEIFQMAQSMAIHAAQRQTATAGNVANADTPGYRARDAIPFAEAYAVQDHALRATRAGHLAPLEAGRRFPIVFTPGEPAPNGNTVSLETEMVRAAEIRGQHERALAIYRSGLHMLRVSIGRG